MTATPFFPNTVWQGQSSTRKEGLQRTESPDPIDWEQSVAEVKAIEDFILNHPGGSGVALSLAGTNKDSVTFSQGMPIANHSSGIGFVRASAANNSANCIGLATVGAPANGTEIVQMDGPVALSDWSAVIGTVTLAPKALYYLDITAGMLTTNAPVTPGQVVQLVGEAVSDTTLEMRLSLVILL